MSTGRTDKPLRMLERVIDAGDQGRYLVQVAATTQSVDGQVAQFEIDLGVTFVLLALLLMAAMAVQARYGLLPLRRLRKGVDRRAARPGGKDSRRIPAGNRAAGAMNSTC